jgi:periplasmic protein TonB
MMWAGFSSTAPINQPRAQRAVGTTASGLGLFEYPPIGPLDGSTTPGVSKPVDVSGERSLLCLALPSPRLPARSRSAGRGGVAAVAVHAGAVAVVISLAAWSRSSARLTVNAITDSPQVPRLVFVLQPGPDGGGGGGGNRQPGPPSRAQAIGHDRLIVPIVRRAEVQASSNDAVPREPQALLDAKPLAAGSVFMTGLPEASPSLPFSRGPGGGEGVGTGTGSGIGSGAGPGMGPGSGGGFGGGAYRLGSGVTPPTLLKQVTPKYTADAMRQRIQGVVALEVVISRDGIPIAIRVTRSLDQDWMARPLPPHANGVSRPGVSATRPLTYL